MTQVTKDQIRDSQKYFRQMCEAMAFQNSNAFPEVQTIETILQSALDAGGDAWQPIETAPRDGTEIMGIFSNDYGYQEKPTIYGPWTIAWDGKKFGSSWDGSKVVNYTSDFGTDYMEPDCDPTHWQPLPAPPTLTQPSTTGAGE